MNISQKIAWNEDQAEKNGWTPNLWDCTDFNEELVNNIIQFQQEYGLSADGLCGSTTYRTKISVEMKEDTLPLNTSSSEYIIYNDEKFPINWDKVVLWGESGGLKCESGTYSYYAQKRLPRFFVTHWDVCLSSSICAKVLADRGISVHFCIDNDGTIYQLMDINHAAWHAGSRSWNHSSVGVEISNAYSLKWQSWYEDRGFGSRPIIENARVHNQTLDPFLGFFDVQKQALAALYEAIHNATGIPYDTPSVKDGVDPQCANELFTGFCSHYHLTTRKIDCAGLDLDEICEKAITLSSDE